LCPAEYQTTRMTLAQWSRSGPQATAKSPTRRVVVYPNFNNLRSDGLSDAALAPQLVLKPIQGREDETCQFGVLSKEDTGDCHYFATGSSAHTGNHQRHTEEGNRCELTLPVAKDR